ncbi:hypothetical protein MOUN0_K02630 [Monosporozyma unispora]|nr:hypothetical protein C6P44_000959 [Kazachstania unispora]
MSRKDIKPEEEFDEPWLFNYTPPESWLDSPFSPTSFQPFNIFNPIPPPSGILQGITGLYNYKIPTEPQFAQCNKVNGLSLWDQNGWWQCLFPQEVVRERLQKVYKDVEQIDMNRFVTKEKIKQDPTTLENYFNDYTKYLVWKFEQSARQREEIKQNKINNNNNWLSLDNDNNNNTRNTPTTPEDMMQLGMVNNGNSGKKVIGKSQYMSYNNELDSNGVDSSKEIKTTKTYYDDGSCLIKETEKVTPKDGGKPIINEREKVVNDKPSSSSWF